MKDATNATTITETTIFAEACSLGTPLLAALTLTEEAPADAAVVVGDERPAPLFDEPRVAPYDEPAPDGEAEDESGDPPDDEPELPPELVLFELELEPPAFIAFALY